MWLVGSSKGVAFYADGDTRLWRVGAEAGDRKGHGVEAIA